MIPILVIVGSVGLCAGIDPAIAQPAPAVYYADPTGRDTSVCKFKGQYFLYYSIAGEKQKGWSIGIATSPNLQQWTFARHLTPEIEAEKNGFCAPGCRVINGRVHLFYQSYGSGPKDAILMCPQ